MVSRSTLIALCVVALLAVQAQGWKGPPISTKIDPKKACTGNGFKNLPTTDKTCQTWITSNAKQDADVTGAVNGQDNCVVLDNPGKAPAVSKCCSNASTGKYQAVGTYNIKCGHSSLPQKTLSQQFTACFYTTKGC